MLPAKKNEKQKKCCHFLRRKNVAEEFGRNIFFRNEPVAVVKSSCRHGRQRRQRRLRRCRWLSLLHLSPRIRLEIAEAGSIFVTLISEKK